MTRFRGAVDLAACIKAETEMIVYNDPGAGSFYDK